MKSFPVATNPILHFPLMFPETMKGFHVPGIPYAKLEFLYSVGSAFGLSEGGVRTALSRMKKSRYVEAIKSGASTRYRVSPLQLEVMSNLGKRRPRKAKGYIVAIYSFESGKEKERAVTRSLLEYAGFVRFAQNSYIGPRTDQRELRGKLGESGVASHVFLFDIEEVRTEDMDRMASAWKIPERAAYLDSFLKGAKAYLGGSDGTDADIFNRMAGAWVSYIVNVHSSEPPLPEDLLPERYAYSLIGDYLRKESLRNGKKMMRYYLGANR